MLNPKLRVVTSEGELLEEVKYSYFRMLNVDC